MNASIDPGRPALLGPALLAVAFFAALQGLGCEPATSPSASNSAVSSTSVTLPAVEPVVHLVESRVTIEGEALAVSEPVRWSGEQTKAWTIQPDAAGARILSPELSGHSDLTRFSFHWRAGAGREAIATPMLTNGGQARNQRIVRKVHRLLQPAESATASSVVEFDLTEAIEGNWLDETRQGELARLEVLVVGADPTTLGLEEVIAQTASSRFEGRAAGTGRIARDGIVRPAWFVHAGRSLRVELEVPEASAALRWHGSGTTRRVRVLDGEGEHELATHSGGQGSWTSHSARLDRWRGRPVTLEFAAEGEGVAFFGDPRVLSVAGPDGPAKSQPLVIVYLVDTLRADRLGAGQDDASGRTPHFDRLAREGSVFTRALSTSSWTKPAIPSLMTGLEPTTHRIGSRTYADRLPVTVPVVQQIYRDAGWRTVSLSASPLGSSLSGLDRGFGTAYLPRHWRGRIGERSYATASDLHEALLAWQAEEPDQPGFVYLHTIDVHQYERPFYRGDAFEGLHPYDAAIAEADRQLGELLAGLEAAPGAPEILLVVVSDHGESFGDHGLQGHGRGLFQSQIHIPMIFWAPGRIASRAIDSPASLTDLGPTLLDIAGLSFPEPVQGQSLLPVLRGERDAVHDYVGSSFIYFPFQPQAKKQFSLVSNPLGKLIVLPGEQAFFFDLQADPEELQPLDPPQEMMRALHAWLTEQSAATDAFAAEHVERDPELVDAAQIEQLRELGYIE